MNDNEKKAVLCPNCHKLVSADEPKCPYCGQAGPGAAWRQIRLMRGLQSPEQFVQVIIWTNVVMFGLSLLLGFQQLNLSVNPLGFLSPPSDILLVLGATGTIPIDRLHRWWSRAYAPR